MGVKVAQPKRRRKVAQMLEEPLPVRPTAQLPILLAGEAGGDEILELPRPVDGSDGAAARAGERASAIDDLLQDGGHVEARADSQDRRTQRGDTLPQRFCLGIGWVRSGHRRLLVGWRASWRARRGRSWNNHQLGAARHNTIKSNVCFMG